MKKTMVKSVQELEAFIEEAGFLPLFRNELEGFSVEEITDPADWWCGESSRDPWLWREILAGRGKLAYGKFFAKKTGFISRAWFPLFANARRDGYDFDARWDDELAGIRSKRIMDLFMEENEGSERLSPEVKALAGFGKGGEKNFEGEMALLQMQTYLVVKEFRRKKDARGREYGLGSALFCTPEHLFGYGHCASAYGEDPGESQRKIYERAVQLNPNAPPEKIRRLLAPPFGGERTEKKSLPYPLNLIRALKLQELQELSQKELSADRAFGLEIALCQLRDKQQRTIRMKYEQGKSNEEIGRLLDRAAGTVGSYHSKGMGKLRWPQIRCWYLDGYERTLKGWLEKKGIAFEGPTKGSDSIREEDCALKIGMSLSQFESLSRAGILTVKDLKEAIEAAPESWFRPVKGIGPRGAEAIRAHLERGTVPQKDTEGKEETAWPW